MIPLGVLSQQNLGGMPSLLTGMQAWYELEESSGDFIDSHSTRDLIRFGAPNSIAAKIGNGMETTLAAQYAYIVAGHGMEGGDRDFTWVGWWKSPSSLAAIEGLLSCGVNTSAAQNDYVLITNATNNLEFYVPSGSTWYFAKATGVIAVSTWYFIVASFEAATNEIKLNVNEGTPVTGTTIGTPNTIGGPVYLGFYIGYAYGKGLYDQWSFFTRLLTAAETAWLYNGGDGRAYSEI